MGVQEDGCITWPCSVGLGHHSPPAGRVAHVMAEKWIRHRVQGVLQRPRRRPAPAPRVPATSLALQPCPHRGASEAAPWLVQPKIHLLWAFTTPLAEPDLENKKTKQTPEKPNTKKKKKTPKIRCAVKFDFQINNKSFFSVSMSPAIFRT